MKIGLYIKINRISLTQVLHLKGNKCNYFSHDAYHSGSKSLNNKEKLQILMLVGPPTTMAAAM